jgi:hypothetical protein
MRELGSVVIQAQEDQIKGEHPTDVHGSMVPPFRSGQATSENRERVSTFTSRQKPWIPPKPWTSAER